MPRLSSPEIEAVFRLAADLTGTCQEGRFRHNVIVSNIERRLDTTRAKNLREYLAVAERDPAEFSRMVSSLTIHTTSWFREEPHFERLERHLCNRHSKGAVHLLCAACSTGEEAYSFGLVLENFRQANPGFEYTIRAVDIDPVSVATALRGVYSEDSLQSIPKRYHRFLLQGSGKTSGLIAVSKSIRDRCQFEVQNLSSLKFDSNLRFNSIVCRNVLIYFSPADVSKIIGRFMDLLVPEGVLCLGHSEAINPAEYKLRSLGNSLYARLSGFKTKDGGASTGRILVVDDSATVRKLLTSTIAKAGLEVSAVACAEEASRFLEKNEVDLITLDLQMPGMSGQAWLRAQRDSGMRVPVVILSGQSPQDAMEVLGALESGAQDYIDKSVLNSGQGELVDRLKVFIQSYREPRRNGGAQIIGGALTLSHPDVVLIGASTGGTQVLTRMLARLPSNSPPVMVTQHIAPAFARAFAERLAQASGLILADPRQEPQLAPGHLYMALDDYHIQLVRKGGRLLCTASNAAPVNRHRPSVDALFRSASLISDLKLIGVLLTGMGNDGAKGLLELKNAGATTLVQDEASCVVFGMPKEAIKLEAAQFVGDPAEIRKKIDIAIRAP